MLPALAPELSADLPSCCGHKAVTSSLHSRVGASSAPSSGLFWFEPETKPGCAVGCDSRSETNYPLRGHLHGLRLVGDSL